MRPDKISMLTANGHLYAIIRYSDTVSWDTHNAFIQSDLEAGTSDWHLATVSTAAENEVLMALMAQVGSSYSIFGLVQDPGSNEPADGWVWITEEALTYTFWSDGEPNNTPDDPNATEDFGMIYSWGGWNDFSVADPYRFALAELDTARAVRLVGSSGNDRLIGGNFDDRLGGSAGNDRLVGFDGADTLAGGQGHDRIRGGADQDRLTGGAGADVFIFSPKDFGNATTPDTITDFEQGLDLISLDLVLPHGLAIDPSLTFIGADAFSATAGELRAEQTGGTTRIEGDIDGDGLADIAVILTGTYTLTAADFGL